MPDDKEVRIRLVLNDQSSETLNRVKAGMQELGAKTEEAKAKTDLLGSAAQLLENPYVQAAAAVAAVTAAIGVAILAADKLGEASIEAADEAERQERAMAGNIMLMGRGTLSFQQSSGYAKEIREEMERAGIAAGVSGEKMSNTFAELTASGRVGVEQAEKITDQMSIVGKVVPGGMESLSSGFAMLEYGVARARNPMVQLIAATGTLKGNAREVAREMEKMAPDQMLAVAEKALARQADMMKKTGSIPAPTLDELKESLKGVRESFLQSIGQPMLEHLIPPLTKVKNFLVEHLDEIRHFGEMIGNAFGALFDTLSDIFGGIYQVIKENWADIKVTAQEAVQPIVDAFNLFRDNKKDIAEWSHVLIDAMDVVRDTVIVVVELFKDVWNTIVGSVKIVAGIVEGIYHALPSFALNEDKEQAAERAANDLVAEGMKQGFGTNFIDESVKKMQEHDRAVNAAREQQDEQKSAPAGGGLKGHLPKGSSGNVFVNTINIKQDYRDQDPDRVAIVFRRDLMKHALARGQSKLASFGGL